jgi:hypothetical protein
MIFLILGITFASFLLYVSVTALKKCQNNESMACPSYSCPVPDPDTKVNCGIQPWRINENGEKICMQYLAQSAIPKGKVK